MSRKQDREWRRIKQRREAAIREGKTKYTDRKLRTPMSYLGAKSFTSANAAGPLVLSYFPPDVREVVSPFLGGGSLEMELLRLGKTVYAGDLYQPQANYWRAMLADGRRVWRHAEALVEELAEDGTFHSEPFRRVIDIATDPSEDPFRRAAAQWIRSKQSYGGDCQFGGPRNAAPLKSKDGAQGTRHVMRRLGPSLRETLLVGHYHLQRAKSRFHFAEQDWRQTMDQHPEAFAYIDPPYFGMEYYYRATINQAELASYLRDRPNWIMSNSDTDATRKHYEGLPMVNIRPAYGTKVGSELLIFSRDLRALAERSN